MARYLLILVLGLGVGYLLGTTMGESTAPRATERAPIQEPNEAVFPKGDSDLAAELRKLPVPSVARGNGRITGVVKDANGKGVSGVTVRAVRQIKWTGRPRRRGDGPPPRRDLEDVVREYVRGFQEREQATVDAITDSSGAFVLTGLAAAEHRVAAYLEGFDIRPDGNAYKARPGSTVDFTARPVVSVKVDVILPDGSRPDSASVRANRDSHRWSPEYPEIRVAPGSYTFTASVTGYKSQEVKADVPGGDIVVRLEGRPGIKGKVRFADGTTFSNLHVYALRFKGDKAPTAKQLAESSNRDSLWRNDDHKYEFQDLKPGRYLVGVGARGGAIFRSEVVDVTGFTVTLDLEVGAIDPAQYVVVKVFAPDGTPVKEFDIGTSYRTENSSSSGGSTWGRRKDGTLMVFHHDHDYEEGGTYGVEIKSKKYGKKKTTYKRGEQQALELRFGEPATLAVTIRGFADSEHSDAITLALRGKNDDESHGWSSESPDAAGVVTLGPVETGEYEVIMYIKQERHRQLAGPRQAVSLRPGANKLALAMPALYPLTVIADKGTRLQVRRADTDLGGGVTKTCDAEGRASFPALPAGRYKISSWGGLRSGEMEVVVPGAAEVAFKPQKQNALKVTIKDPAGKLGQAGFLTGDIVIALDGTEFRDMMHLQLLMAGAMSKDEVTFTVLRGTQRVEITLNVKDMMGGGNQGGRMEPTRR